ncbi:MAG TPA: hypothetical protein PLZ16_07855, partial [Gammaproteobacteria bacterium]|nr:hypothetical protein [Gammaproteobacteria bacterium]
VNYSVFDNIFNTWKKYSRLSWWGGNLKNCKLCRYSELCNTLPGICILLQYLAVALLIGMLGYLFITQEFLR